MDCIFYMCVVITDAESYIYKTQEKSLEVIEKDKKRKYLDYCLQQRLHFSQSIVSVSIMMVTEVKLMLKRLDIRLTTTWQQPYSWTCGYVRSRFVMAMVRATHNCIRGSRVPKSWISVQ